jgi:hypothetical protein
MNLPPVIVVLLPNIFDETLHCGAAQYSCEMDISSEVTDMEKNKAENYETVLETVRQWPPDRRFALVRDVINTLATDVLPGRARRNTLEGALGLLATDRPAPSDAEVQEWLDRRRMEKYG